MNLVVFVFFSSLSICLIYARMRTSLKIWETSTVNSFGPGLCFMQRLVITSLFSLFIIIFCKLFMFSGFNFGRSCTFTNSSTSFRFSNFLEYNSSNCLLAIIWISQDSAVANPLLSQILSTCFFFLQFCEFN